MFWLCTTATTTPPQNQLLTHSRLTAAADLPLPTPRAAQIFKQQYVTEAGAVAAAAACLATFGCSLRFGLVLLAVSYSSCKLRQFKEARVVQDYTTVSTPLAAQQQQLQQEQQQPRDWLEVGVCARSVAYARLSRPGCCVCGICQGGLVP